MRKFGLIGFPLSHSFSPGFFASKFEKAGIPDCTYDAFPISAISQLEELLISNPELEGLNVTIPYKKEVIPYLHEQSDAVLKLGACNCIKISNGRLSGHNTDITGFEESLKPLLQQKHQKALVLGTGGAAAAVIYVLEKLGIEYTSVSRSAGANEKTVRYNDLTEEIIKNNLLIINTSPVGMYPAVDEYPAIPYDYLTPDHYLFDLIYNPAETAFLEKGLAKGATVKNGADMLIIQAEESWKIWNEK